MNEHGRAIDSRVHARIDVIRLGSKANGDAIRTGSRRVALGRLAARGRSAIATATGNEHARGACNTKRAKEVPAGKIGHNDFPFR
jgi:hypothetical protein